MRLLQIIASLDPKTGGPSESVRQFSVQATRLGHQIEIVSLDDPDAAWAVDLVVDEQQIPVTALGPTKSRYGYNPKLVSWLTEHAHRFDAAIVRGLWQYHGSAARSVFRQTGTPYFVFAHGMLDPWFKRTYPLKHLKKLLYWFLIQHAVLRDAAGVLFTSEEERLLARRSFPRYRCHEIVVSYGTAEPSVAFSGAQAEFFKRYPSLHERSFFLFLGRIHVKKGVDLLLEAFAACSGCSSKQLVLAGPVQADLRAQLEAQARVLNISERVVWTGMIEGAAKWGALAAAEVFVLPSHQENFGIAVAEALACGTPVLISDKVNIWREIQADGAGLVEPDTRIGTTRLLEQWTGMSEPEQAAMRAQALETFRQRFTIERAATSLLDAVERRVRTLE